MIPKRDKGATGIFEVKIIDTNEVIYSNEIGGIGGRSSHAESIDDKLEILEKIEEALDSLPT